MTSDAPWPTELRLTPEKNELIVRFDDHSAYALSAEYLRVTSPSAEVQGHSEDQRQTVPGKKNVTIAKLEPVGNYAVRIIFDDGHDSGLYSWSYLRELGIDKDSKWRGYLSELKAKGMSRD